MTDTLVLFDVDGTLIDTAGAGRRSLHRAFERVLGLQDPGAASARVRFHGKTDPSIIADIAREAGVLPGEIAMVAASIERAYLDALRDEMTRRDPRRRVLPGVVALLEALESLPRTWLGLLTGNIEEGARTKLEPFDLNRFFPDGGFASDDGDRQHIARIAHAKLSRRAGTEFPPERTFVVGDTELDIACAKANGFRAIAVATGGMSRERLSTEGPDALFDDLADTRAVLAAMELARRGLSRQ